MIPLLAAAFPTDAGETATAIQSGLAHAYGLAVSQCDVSVEGDPPRVRRLIARLGGAGSEQGALAAASAPSSEPPVAVDHLEWTADPVWVDGAAVHVWIVAKDVVLRRSAPQRSTTPAGVAEELCFLVPSGLREGRLKAKIGRSDLEKLLFVHVARAAKSRGVDLREISLDLAASGPRSVLARVRLVARKLVSAEAFLEAELHIDDRLDAVLTGVTARVGGFLSPLFKRAATQAGRELEGKRLPLSSIALGAARLKDIQITVEDGLFVHAELAVPEQEDASSETRS